MRVRTDEIKGVRAIAFGGSLISGIGILVRWRRKLPARRPTTVEVVV
jgi:hypothetical protein